MGHALQLIYRRSSPVDNVANIAYIIHCKLSNRSADDIQPTDLSTSAASSLIIHSLLSALTPPPLLNPRAKISPTRLANPFSTATIISCPIFNLTR